MNAESRELRSGPYRLAARAYLPLMAQAKAIGDRKRSWWSRWTGSEPGERAVRDHG